MTFDTETRSVQPLMCEADTWELKRHETTHYKPKTPHVRQKDATDDFCKDTQIANWEDEGGAYADRVDAVFRDSSINSGSVLAVHMDAAEALMTSGDYDGAFAELQAAAERFISYRDRLNNSLHSSIARLSNQGCRATPPHPKALPLVKLHQQITP